jgi:hypothetical protein
LEKAAAHSEPTASLRSHFDHPSGHPDGGPELLTRGYAAGAWLTSSRPTKPLSRSNEAGLKQTQDTVDHDQQRSSIMWALIMSLIYEQSCEKYLADLLKHQHRWI